MKIGHEIRAQIIFYVVQYLQFCIYSQSYRVPNTKSSLSTYLIIPIFQKDIGDQKVIFLISSTLTDHT